MRKNISRFSKIPTLAFTGKKISSKYINKLKYYHLSLIVFFLAVGAFPTLLYDLRVFGEKALLSIWIIPSIILLGTPYALTMKKKASVVKRIYLGSLVYILSQYL